MEQENNNYQPDAKAFLDAISKEETSINPRPKQEILEEAFPFSDDFDIDAFVAANDNPLEKTLTAMKATPAPATQDSKDFNINLQKDKDENIKELETKITDIQNQIEDTTKETQQFSSLPSELFEEQPTPANYVSSIKANDEFFTNIASTVDALKGSLDNIVKARLQYEEGIVRQDQNLIARLREKTSRLKAINLALNSEVKRAKNEKLESLRKSAQQTKELLALRMQMSQFQEQSEQGNFKLSRLEQQLNMAVEEKRILEDEISKIRQEKLDSFKASAEQMRQIMALRFDLAKTEEKFKQKEAQTLALQNQLEDFRQKAVKGDKDLYEGQINDLKNQLAQASLASRNEADLAGSLRENILFLESSLAKTKGSKTALLAKAQEHLTNLFNLKGKYEQEINLLKTEQLKVLETAYQQEGQKREELTNQVKRTLTICRNQESFIKTLQAQIDSFKQAIAELDKNAEQEPSAEYALLKEAHLKEISSLKKTLQEEQSKYRNQNLEYQNLSARLSQTEQQKQILEQQLAGLLSTKEETQQLSNNYLEQIKELKTSYDALKAKYNSLDTKQADRQIFDLQKNALEEELKVVLKQKIDLLTQVEEKDKLLASFKKESQEKTEQLKEQAKQQIAVLENKLAGVQEKLKNEEDNVASLKNQIATLLQNKDQSGKVQISQEIFNLKEQLTKAQNKFTQESVLLSQLKEDSAAKKEEFATLEAKYQDLANQKELLQKNIEEQDKKIAAFKLLLENVQNELKAEKAARKQLEEKVSKLKAVNIALTKKIRQVREQKIEALKKSVQQAKAILALKEELSKRENLKTVEFENGLVKVRQEYETKVSSLEKKLADLSENFSKQVKEIEQLKTDNAKLKKAEEEKFTLEEEYNSLVAHAKELEQQISDSNKQVSKETHLAKAKAAALAVQIARVEKDKKALSDQLKENLEKIKTLTADGDESRKSLIALKEKLAQNDAVILSLKQEIFALKQDKKIQSENAQVLKPAIKEPENKPQQQALNNTPKEAEPAPKQQANVVQETKPSAAPLPPHQSLIQHYEEEAASQETLDTQDTTQGETSSEALSNAAGQEKEKSLVPVADHKSTMALIDKQIDAGEEEDAFATATQREKLFNEILPDTQETEAETFADASRIGNDKLSSQALDLSVIFGAKESIRVEDLDEHEAEEEKTEQVKLSDTPSTQMDFQNVSMDHSVKRQGPRRAVAKDGEEYSDFLGKTKSMFYRIKWSLFKD